MYTPVLITPPSRKPFTTDEVKAHLRVDGAGEDALIDGFQAAAVAHIERTCGLALEQQTWRVSFDAFCQVLRLPIRPALQITGITLRNDEGQLSTVDSDDYALLSDSIGPYARTKDDYTAPGDLYEAGAVTVTWTAGHPETPASGETPAISNVPAALKAAVLLLVGDLYANREAKVGNDLEENSTVKALLSTYRPWAI